MASIVSGTRDFITQKEQEIACMRELALQELEQQIISKDSQLKDINAKFDELKQDFQFNLQLLDERDAELEKYDVEQAALTASLHEKDLMLRDIDAAYAQLSEVSKRQLTAHAEEKAALKSQVLDYEAQLQDLRFQSNELHLRQQEQYESQKRALQRALAESEEEIERQRRDMAAGFTVQVQQMETKYKQQVEEAAQEASLAKQRADNMEEEAKAARAREMAQSKAAEEALGKVLAKERELRGVQWELESVQKTTGERILELQEALRDLQHRHQLLSDDAGERIASLQASLAASQREGEDGREAAACALQRREQQHAEEMAVLRLRWEQAAAAQKEAEGQVQELQSALKLSRASHQDRMDALERDSKLQQEAAQAALADVQRRHEAEVRELKEAAWGREEEVKAVREKLDTLRRNLEERRKDLESYKTQMVAAGERERELQRQLVAAEMKLEARADADDAATMSHHERLVSQLTEQRETANAGLQEALSRCAAKDDEIATLRQRLKSLGNAPHPSTTPSQTQVRLQTTTNQPHADAHAHHARYGRSHIPAQAQASVAYDSLSGLSINDILHQAMSSHRSGVGGEGDVAHEHFQGKKPTPLQLSQSIQDLKEALGELSNLPSPLLPDMPPTPGSTASFWLGPSASQEKGMAVQMGSPRRSTAFDRSMDSLRRHPGASTSPGTARQQHLEAQLTHLTTALEDARQQNQRLLSTITMMRSEVERLQQQQQELQQQAEAAPPPPEDVQVMRAELAAADQDLHHAYEHLAVVQQQASGSSGSGQQGGPGTESGELLYLRTRVQLLLTDNRSMRREVMAVRLAATGSTVQPLPELCLPAVAAATESSPSKHQPVSTGELPTLPPTPTEPQQQQHQQQQQQHVAAAAAPEPPDALISSDMLEDLAVELEAARDQIQRLESDNHQLMEMSSVLRAERDRLALRLSAQGSQDAGSPVSPQSSSPWGMNPFLLPFFNPYLNTLSRPSPEPSTSPPPQDTNNTSSTAPAVRDVLQAVANRRAANSSRQQQQSSSAGPSSPTRDPPPSLHARYSTPNAPHLTSAHQQPTHHQQLLRSSAPPATTPFTQSTDGLAHSPSQSHIHTQHAGAHAEPGAGQDAVYVVRCERCLEDEGGRRMEGGSRSPSPRRRSSFTRKASEPLTRGPTPINANPSGPLGLGTSLTNPARKASPPAKISERETPSQRARLRALQQRREPKAKVRNYNLKDEST